MKQLFALHMICFVYFFHPFGTVVYSQNFDINFLRSVNPQNSQDGFWQATSNSYKLVAGAASLGPLAYAFIKKDEDLKYKSYELLMAIGINFIVTNGLKAIINRTRPADQYPDEIFVLTKTSGSSFPSGHTSLAFATATSLALTHKKWYITVPAYLWAGCVGYSRMYLGKHYPSDVLGGAVVGAGSSVLSHWLSKKLFVKKPAGSPLSNSWKE